MKLLVSCFLIIIMCLGAGFQTNTIQPRANDTTSWEWLMPIANGGWCTFSIFCRYKDDYSNMGSYSNYGPRSLYVEVKASNPSASSDFWVVSPVYKDSGNTTIKTFSWTKSNVWLPGDLWSYWAYENGQSLSYSNSVGVRSVYTINLNTGSYPMSKMVTVLF